MTMTTPGPVDARIIQDHHGLEVHPSVVFKRKREYFTLLNHAKWLVHVKFPTLPIDPREADIEPGRDKTFTILDPEPGVYYYVVELTITDERKITFTLRARGGSDPRIIIDY